MDIYEIDLVLKKLLLQSPIQDYGINGVQIEKIGPVAKIALAVDSAIESVEKAHFNNCDLILVHHGLFWGRELTITGSHYNRLKLFLDNNIGLIAYHLPLDCHPVIGNNAMILKTIGINSFEPFHYTKGTPIGYTGVLDESVGIEEICKKLGILLRDTKYLNFGHKMIQKVAVVSGSGSGALENAAKCGADLFITGDSDHILYHQSQELGINVLFAGHYFTETFGIKALGEYITSETGIQSLFIDIPTGL